jgi:hypothetical protein
VSTLPEKHRRAVVGLLIVPFVGCVLLAPLPAKALPTDRASADTQGPNAVPAVSQETGTAAVEKQAQVKVPGRKKHFPWLGAVLSLALAGGLFYYFVILKTTLQVNTDPPGARIFADGKDSGLESPCLLKLAVGAHDIKAVREGYADVEVEVVVKNGKNTVDIPLDIGTFALSSPAANENIQRETECQIRWDSSAMAKAAFLPSARKALAVTLVDLDLCQDDSLVEHIARSVPNSGTYAWNVPGTTREGHNFKIRILCSDAPDVRAVGPAFNLLGFREDFADNRADFWLPDPGSSWTVNGGSFTAARAGEGFSLAIYDFFYGESAYAVEARMRWNEAGAAARDEEQFVMLGSSNSFSGNSGYLLGCDREGGVRIYRVDNFDFQTEQSGSMTALYSGFSGAVIPGLLNWNTLRVVRSGSSYSLFINGTLVHTLVDGTYNPTHVMVGFHGVGTRTVGELDHVRMAVDPEKK